MISKKVCDKLVTNLFENRAEGDVDMSDVNKMLEATCKSGADVFKWICSQTLPTGDHDELSEEELEFVAGGMSEMNAMEVIAAAYYDLCVKKKGKTSYSDSQIYEALNVCHRMNRWNKNTFEEIGKVTSLLVMALNKK